MSAPITKPQLPPEISPEVEPKTRYWARRVRETLRDILAYTSVKSELGTTEIDFGTTPVQTKSFTVTDAAITSSMYITANVAYVAPTGKSLDELEFDSLELKCAAGTGQFTLFARSLTGPVIGKFKVVYTSGL